jgi:hypothetical protein
MRKIRNVNKVWMGRLKGNRPHGRPRHGWKNNINTDLREGE